VERLRHDLHRDGVICAGDLSPARKDEKPEHAVAPPARSSSDQN
jgi:hypothetical protein